MLHNYLCGYEMRNFLLRLAIISVLGCLTACGGGGGGVTPPSAQVSALEASGRLPNLDRTSSLTGTVTNRDGVRDDIALWIEQRPATPAQKTALTALAIANQKALTVDVTNDVALRAVVAQQHAAVKCVVRREANQLAGIRTVPTLRDYTANTPQRAQAYRNYTEALNGAVLKSPDGDGCVN